MKTKSTYSNFDPVFFQEKSLIYKQEIHEKTFKKLPEKITTQNLTEEKLQELKDQIGNFDAGVRKVRHLNAEIESTTTKEKNLLQQVKTRFTNYSSQIARLEKGPLNPKQRDLLEAIKQILKQLKEDIKKYRSGKRHARFESEYLSMDKFFTKEGFQFLDQYINSASSSEKVHPVPLADEGSFFTAEQMRAIKQSCTRLTAHDLKRILSEFRYVLVDDVGITTEKVIRILQIMNDPETKTFFFFLPNILGKGAYKEVREYLLKIFFQNSENIPLLIQHKDDLQVLTSFLLHYQSAYLLNSQKIADVLDLIPLIKSGDSFDNVVRKIGQNPKYLFHPDFRKFFREHNRLFVRENEMAKELQFQRDALDVESKLKEFMVRYSAESAEGLKLGLGDEVEAGRNTVMLLCGGNCRKISSRKMMLNINKKILLVFDKHMDIDYQKSVLVDSDHSAFHLKLKESGIRNIADLKPENFSLIKKVADQEIEASRRASSTVSESRKKLISFEYDVEDKVKEFEEQFRFHNLRLYTTNNCVRLRLRGERITILRIDAKTLKIVRVHPDLKELFLQQKIQDLDVLEDKLELVLEALAKRGTEAKKKKRAREKRESSSIYREIGHTSEELREMFPGIYFEVYTYERKNGAMLRRLKIESRVLDLEMKVGPDYSIKIRQAKVGYMSNHGNGSASSDDSVTQFSNSFLAELGSKIKSLTDFSKYQNEINTWHEENLVAHKEIVRKRKIERARRNERYNKRGEKLDSEKSAILQAFYDRGFSKESVFLHHRSREIVFAFSDRHISGGVRYKGDQLVYLVENGGTYTSRDEFIKAILAISLEKETKDFLKRFPSEDFYQLSEIFPFEFIIEKIAPMLDKGVSQYAFLILDIYTGAEESEYANDPKLLNYLLRPLFFAKLDHTRRKILLEGVDANIQGYSEAEDKKEKLEIIEEQLEKIHHIILDPRTPQEHRTEAIQFITERLGNQEEEIQDLLFEKCFELTYNRGFSDSAAKTLFVGLNSKLDVFSPAKRDQVYSLMSNVELLVHAPRELQEEIIKKTIEFTARSKDRETVLKNIDNLLKMVYRNEFAEFKPEIEASFWRVFSEEQKLVIKDLEIRNNIYTAIGNYFLRNGTPEQFEQLLGYAETERTKLARFLAINLSIGVKQGKYEEYAQRVEALKQKQNLLPEKPPTKEILADGKFIAYIYFGDKSSFNTWEADLFHRPEYNWQKEDRADEMIYVISGAKKDQSGKLVPIEVHIPKTFGENNERVFEKMNDRKVDYVQYVGHAGGRNQLSNAIQTAYEAYAVQQSDQAKIFVGQACYSFKNYAPDIKRIFPYAQYIGTKDTSNIAEGQNIFEVVLDGVLHDREWGSREKGKETGVYKDMLDRPSPFIKKKGRWTLPKKTRGITASNYVLPNDPEILNVIDSDGDGVPDSKDTEYNLIVSKFRSEETCNPSLPAPNEQPGHRPLDILNVIDRTREVFFPFVNLDISEYANDYNIQGWYSEYDDQRTNLLKIYRNGGEQNNFREVGDRVLPVLSLEIQFNTRFMRASDRALVLMAMKEIGDYLYKNYDVAKWKRDYKEGTVKDYSEYSLEKPKALAAKEKEVVFYSSIIDLMRAFQMPQNRDNFEAYRDLYESFKEKHEIPAELDFVTAYQFAWSKTYAGNKDYWKEDTYLKPLYDNYKEYLTKLKKPTQLKTDPHFKKYRELKKKGKDNDTIAQYLACEDVMKKVRQP